MPQGSFQFFRRLSQNRKKAGLCPDISIRASANPLPPISPSFRADRKPLATISQYGAHSNGDVQKPADRRGHHSGSAVTIYLPIAELSVNIFIILGMGAAVGFLSGMFGVGGGFLITPLLIFYNIPPVVAVATGANQVVASSISGAITHFRRGTLDVKLGTVLLIGGLSGATVGIWIFSLLRAIGQLDLIISLMYVIFLGTVGGLMLLESINAMRRAARNEPPAPRKPGHQHWVHKLPLKVRFKKSKIFLSVIPIVALGFAIGILTSIMGVGGGFIMVPAMIYLLRIPTNVVVGTSLFQIIFVTAYTTIVQAATNFSVDIVLAFILMVAGVIGAQYGVRVGQKLRGEQLRALLGLLVLAVGLRLAIALVVTPADVYSVVMGAGN
ncbi:putative membrane protein YfcA [Rhizobium leguminosarum]|nr:putative membrane protein YfcA [Rhizobium leguminosarum]